MTINEAKFRILGIKSELYLLLINHKGIDTNRKIRELHREYCKLIVQIREAIPSFDKWPYNNNCYFYALDIPTPNIFYTAFKRLEKKDFHTNLGEISGLPFLDKFERTEKNFLEYVYTDLDALKYQVFDSAINLPPKHGGYKIAMFIDTKSCRPDYHFVRQNVDGLWSQKIGSLNTFCLSESPLDYVNYCVHEYGTDKHKDRNFEYIKTIEVVKPTLKRTK